MSPQNHPCLTDVTKKDSSVFEKQVAHRSAIPAGVGGIARKQTLANRKLSTRALGWGSDVCREYRHVFLSNWHCRVRLSCGQRCSEVYARLSLASS